MATTRSDSTLCDRAWHVELLLLPAATVVHASDWRLVTRGLLRRLISSDSATATRVEILPLSLSFCTIRWPDVAANSVCCQRRPVMCCDLMTGYMLNSPYDQHRRHRRHYHITDSIIASSHRPTACDSARRSSQVESS